MTGFYSSTRYLLHIFLHLQRSMASSLFHLRAWQSSRTTSFQVFFGLPLGLGPSTPTPTLHWPNIHTSANCTSYRVQAASVNEWLCHFRHATLYTTTFLTYPFLASCDKENDVKCHLSTHNKRKCLSRLFKDTAKLSKKVMQTNSRMNQKRFLFSQ